MFFRAEWSSQPGDTRIHAYEPTGSMYSDSYTLGQRRPTVPGDQDRDIVGRSPAREILRRPEGPTILCRNPEPHRPCRMIRWSQQAFQKPSPPGATTAFPQQAKVKQIHRVVRTNWALRHALQRVSHAICFAPQGEKSPYDILRYSRTRQG